METPRFEEWAIVEVMGHAKYVGYVSEQTIAGSAFVRVDVPSAPIEPASRYADKVGPVEEALLTKAS